MRKPIFIIGTLAYAIITIISVMLFEERIIFKDSSYYVIPEGGFNFK